MDMCTGTQIDTDMYIKVYTCINKHIRIYIDLHIYKCTSTST